MKIKTPLSLSVFFLFFTFPLAALAQGIVCTNDFRSEGGPFEEVKLIKVGTSFKLSLKQSPPGGRTAPTEKTLLDKLNCRFATNDSQVALCTQGGRDSEESPFAAFRKVTVTQLESLEETVAGQKTSLDVEIQGPQVDPEESGFSFPPENCKGL